MSGGKDGSKAKWQQVSGHRLHSSANLDDLPIRVA